ncbi:putative nudix hydrolase 7, partial [Zancudomyces culisetae]
MPAAKLPFHVPIPSSSIIVTRPILDKAKARKLKCNYELLMTQRYTSTLNILRVGSGNFGGAVVFPGGKLEEQSDYKLASKYVDGNIDSQTALKICSLRETFEETGLDLLQGLKNDSTNATGSGSVDIGTHKDAQYNNKKGIFSINDLSLFAHWITPTHIPKRFDTYFYMLNLPQELELDSSNQEDQNMHNLIHHQIYKSNDSYKLQSNEVVKLFWSTPGQYLDDFHSNKENKIILYPPQYYMLNAIAQFATFQELKKYVDTHSHLVEPITPALLKQKPPPSSDGNRDAEAKKKQQKQQVLLFNGDYQYPGHTSQSPIIESSTPNAPSKSTSADNAAQPLHRIYLNAGMHKLRLVENMGKIPQRLHSPHAQQSVHALACSSST